MTSRFYHLWVIGFFLSCSEPTISLAIEPKLLYELELLGLDRGVLTESELRFLARKRVPPQSDLSSESIAPEAEEFLLKRITLERSSEESLDEFRNRVSKIVETLTPESFVLLARDLQPSSTLRKRWTLSPMTLNQFPEAERGVIATLGRRQISPPLFSESSAVIYLRE